MKFYEYQKSDSTRISKILGIPFYIQTKNLVTKAKSQLFLGGLVSTDFSENLEQGYKEKNIKFLKKTIFKITDDGNIQKKYLFNYQIYQKHLKEIFYKKYSKLIDKKYKNIYILNANSGEIYLFLTYLLGACIKKNQSKKILVIATKKYHVEMLNLIYPDIDVILIEKIKPVPGDYSFSINNQNFFIIFPYIHYVNLETKIKNTDLGVCHYFSAMLEKLNIKPEEIQEKNINIPEYIIDNMLKKIKKIELNLDNFVFISPEAYTCNLIDNSFWVSLITALQKNGQDVFVNLTGNKVHFENACFKTCQLTYAEAFALAGRSKKIISLRSGLTEFLMQTDVPIITFYTKFQNRQEMLDMSIEQIMHSFSLAKIPHKSNIREYAFIQDNQQEMLRLALI